MANVRNANSFYIDTQYAVAADQLAVKGLSVTNILVTATAANGRVVLQDITSTPTNKVDLRVATSGDTQNFEFSSQQLLFPNGIRPSTLTNAVVTVIFQENNR